MALSKGSQTEVRFDPITFSDRYSGRTVVQLTSGIGHSYTLYFTDPYWRSADRFIFASDRDGATNYYEYDLSRFSARQLTDLQGCEERIAVYNRHEDEILFWYQNAVHCVQLTDCSTRIRYRISEPGWRPVLSISIDASGDSAYTAITHEPEGGADGGLQYRKSPRYLETFRAKPLTRIVRVPLRVSPGHGTDVVHEEEAHIEHVNASPTRSGLLTYSHEGPWPTVQQRIWAIDVRKTGAWPVRPQSGDVAIGHEYWLNDGCTVGYHGRELPAQQQHLWGWCTVDNQERHEVRFPVHATHVVSHGRDWAVADGTPANVQPWFRRAHMVPLLFVIPSAGRSEGTAEPRVLCEHRSTFHATHPHAQFTPDGRGVLFCSDVSRYSQIYLVDASNLENLPLMPPPYEWSNPVS